jgi:methanogenic corrinoid protein MtbC1
MLKWCAYCQSFLGEIPPYRDFSLTHGICARCEAAHPDLFDPLVVRNATAMKSTFDALFDAGRKNNVGSAEAIIEHALATNFKPVDVLMGMVSPMLYEIGEGWEKGVLTVEDEHRFTAFCEEVLYLISSQWLPGQQEGAGNEPIALVNAPGNRHDLGIRFLHLWLESHGHPARVIEGDIDAIIEAVVRSRPRLLLMSISLPEQAEGVAALVDRLKQAVPVETPRIVVGGHAVKIRAVTHVPGADLCPDINLLDFA